MAGQWLLTKTNTMADQEQFLDVIDRDLAEQRFCDALPRGPLACEKVSVAESLGRVLAQRILAPIDVPSFDRSDFDGFAVRAADTWGAEEFDPATIRLRAESLEAGIEAAFSLMPGEAVSISTGGMVPRGADAVLMIEHAEISDGQVLVHRAVAPGHGITFAGTDIARGETVLREETRLSSRETGVLAALGLTEILVRRRPRVAVVSTGNEILAPGQPMRPACVFDSNMQILSDAIRELGGIPQTYGIVRDDLEQLREIVSKALADCDVVILSGGTSKGRGDLCYKVVAELNDPGIVVHGVALKPGKPLCLAVSAGKPIAVLPGFPTSAIFTFHEFLAPVIRRLGGIAEEPGETINARLAVKVNSQIGRTEYMLVGLADSRDLPAALPMGKGSGSVTTFSRADGFITLSRQTEIREAGAEVRVRLIGHGRRIVDLVVAGSHCIGLDLLLSLLQKQGVTSRLLTIGSTAGLAALRRGECDLAGIHLLHPESGTYNFPYLSDSIGLIPGYARSQGVVYRSGDDRFEGKTLDEIVSRVKSDAQCLMVNRNAGSGTRVLIDQLLGQARPPGFAVQPASHNAVAAAVAQGRADWGVAIEPVARLYGVEFREIQSERFDFAFSHERELKASVQAFRRLLNQDAVRKQLRSLKLGDIPELDG